MAEQKQVPESEPNVPAIRQELEIAINLLYLAGLTNSRDVAEDYLKKVEGQLQKIWVLLGGISSQGRAVS